MKGITTQEGRETLNKFKMEAANEVGVNLKLEKVIALCRERGFTVGTGEFGAEMKVESVNDGPVTIILDTREL